MTRSARTRGRHAVTRLAPKVPEITIMFWIIKVLTTGMGEAASDFLANRSVPLAGGVGLVGFIVAMWLQLRTRRYVTAVYWFAVAMVAVFGTMAADGVHRVLGVPYPATTVFYAAALAAIFYLWHRDERSLSIHSIVTRRREIYYWSAVLATFALGTAAGDLTAFTLHLGYLASIAFFGVAILIPAVAYRVRIMNTVGAFWFAYVLTRPLGASIADYLGKEPDKHGLGYGDGTVTVVATVVILILVGYVAWTGTDVQQQPEDGEPGPRPHQERASVPTQYGAPYRGPVGRPAEPPDR
ncbi:conserved membrane hypothetical protein [Frankia canadensis]|uniref:Membrane-anchored protein n=1 Tax=Frankia canadensis TaxID=1836972 RepID=A0A2I2KWT7_9ACTN|nr:hypothetical protein [Frankia canadensis]SNQ50131.1 conserved membrane hypothetical protein [Frankia canadensis]SOU57421.1 conserved membrane hypothetical protein [Frankia canadensis]